MRSHAGRTRFERELPRALLAFMATRDNDFELSIGRIGRSDAPILGPVQGAVGRAKRASSKITGTRAPNTGLKAHFRKDAGKTTARARGFSGVNRRVIVKTRIVAHGAGKAAPLRAHVAYLAREGRAAGQTLSQEPVNEAAPELSRQVDYLSREGAQ